MRANNKLNSIKKTFAKILLLAFVILVLVFIGGLPVIADTYTSTNFKVLDPVIGAGAERATSDNYILWQSLGEVALGRSTTSNFILIPGFLAFSATATPAASSTSGGGNSYTPTLQKIVITEEAKKKILKIADLNRDGFVNMADLSILLYYYERSDEAALFADLDDKGTVDFPDVSIMIYYWTILS